MSKLSWKGGTMLSPLPVAMVTCGGNKLLPDGSSADSGYKANIVTVAWCGIACSQPPMVYISLRPSRYSHKIISETGEYTVNLVTTDLARAADLCGVYSGRDVDKAEKFSLALEPSATGSVGCPSLADSPLTLDCRVKQVIPLGSHDMFIAEVSGVGVDESLLDSEGKLRLEKAHLAAYSHGDYFELGKKLGGFGFSVMKKSTKKRKAAEASKKPKAEKK